MAKRPLTDQELESINSDLSSGKLDANSLTPEKRASLKQQWGEYKTRKSGPTIGGAISGAANLISGGEMGTAPTGPGAERFETAKQYLSRTPLMAALDAMSKAGQYIEPKIQQAAGYVAEKTGALGEIASQAGYPISGAAIKGAGIGAAGTVGTLAQAAIPKDRLSAAATILGAIPEEAAAEAAYKVPSKAQRAVAEIAGTQSGVKPQHLAAVIANPEIMSDATPSMREVGKEYQEVFKRLGIKFDTRQYQEITKMRYAPNETQTSKFTNILSDAMDKLEKAGEPIAGGKNVEYLAPSEAFIARSAGKKALDGPLSPQAKKQVAADVASLDTFLENHGIPEIKELGQKYFRAAAKESLESIVPRNKQGNPAVVRSLLMAHYGKEALSALSEGKPAKAAIAAGSGAIMSPYVQGKIVPLLGETSPTALKAAAKGSAQMRAILSQRKKDKEDGR